MRNPAIAVIKREKEIGFTLIELSVVLVIIGLIAGGILVGRSLVAASAIRAQVTQLTQLFSAINTFKGKYGALPGDFATPYQFGLSTVASSFAAGNGDGAIEDLSGGNPVHTFNNEPLLFFADLAMARLIPPTYMGTNIAGATCFKLNGFGRTPSPSYYSLAINPSMGMVVGHVNGNLSLYLGMNDCVNGYINADSTTSVMTPEQAYGIDSKIDDGLPLTGSIIDMHKPVNGTLDGLPDAVPNQCLTTVAANTYNIGNGTLQCRLLVKVP